MNQTNPHFTQWKNCTEEEQSGFDFENYQYERQGSIKEWYPIIEAPQCGDGVIRLVIEPEKFYMMSHKDHIEQFCLRGADVTSVDEMIISIRPATEAEIPEPATLEDRVKAEYKDFDVVMFEWERVYVMTSGIGKTFSHLQAQSIRGFFRYVYFDSSEFYTCREPTDEIADKTITPIAALFVRGEG